MKRMTVPAWVFALALCAAPLHGQVITTVAGTTFAFPTSVSQAVNAPLGLLTGVAVDAQGNVYAADPADNIVVQISPAGTLTVVAGNGMYGFSGDGGAATSASLWNPDGVAVDSAGNLYISDDFNGRIRKVSGGTITTVAGNGNLGFSGDGGPAISASFYYPSGVAVDSAGNIYVADQGNNRIRKISGGTITTVAGNGKASYSGDGGPAAGASLAGPYSVAVDSAGSNLYIADYGNNRIREVSGGTITTVAGNGAGGFSGDGGPATSASLNLPYGVAVDLVGNLYITDQGNSRIREVSGGTIATVAGNGSQGFSGDGGPAASASLYSPEGVAVDTAGNIYVADTSNDRIRKVSGGTIATVAGNGGYRPSGDGGPAASASLLRPWGVAVDSLGEIYIADVLNSRIRKVSNGTITTVAGNGVAGSSGDGGPATSASLNLPFGVAIDSAGNLYVADTFNNSIRRVADGIITTVAGDGIGGFSGDGGPATSAAIFHPYGMAIDSAGSLYIADTSNNRIRKVSGGTITTIAGNGSYGFSGDGGPATSASLASPLGVAVDSNGNVYIADTYNNVIRKVSGGTITTVAGNGSYGFSGDGGPAVGASLEYPTGLAADSTGSLYIADAYGNRVRKMSGGTITTVAGNGNVGFSGDGGPPTSASLARPGAVAVDSGGDIYIADNFNNRIRELLAAAPSYTVSPSALTFSAAAGGSAPPNQAVNLTPSTPGLAFTASTSASWLSVTPSNGMMPVASQVAVNATGLAAGTYQGSVTIVAAYGVPASTTIPVTLTVQPGMSPSLNVSTQNITFTATQGSGAVSQSLQVLNNGGGSASFTATVTAGGGSWLSLSSQSGTATPGAPVSLTVTATPGSLAPDTYNGAITVTGAGSTATIAVTLSISPASATMLISQNALTFNAVSQGGTPLPQSFGILNTGTGSMNWTASATTLSGGNWLHISSTGGTVAQPFLSVSPISASVNAANLNAGMYYGQIQIASSGAVNSPQSLTVILNVYPPGTNLGPQIYPNGLIFTGVAGSNPIPQEVMVANTASTSNSYLSGTIGPLSFLPTNAVIQPAQPTTLIVYPDFSSLGAGIARGTVTLQFSDGSPSQSINVLMSVAPVSGVPADERGALQPRAASCPPQALQLIFTQPQFSFAATVGQSVTVEVKVSDSCGNLINPVPGAPAGQQQVTAYFSDGQQASMTNIGNGIWQATWRPVSASAYASIGVDAFTSVDGAVVAGTKTIQGSVTQPAPAASTPLVASVFHAATAVGGVPIAPGELITVKGANLASGPAISLPAPLPSSSNGAQVLLGTQPLPILYASDGQMNVQVPFSVPVNTTYQLSVQNGNTLSVPQTLVVAQAQPGIFTTNLDGFGQGVIKQSDGVTLAQPETPATIGEVIVIYCTGLGAVTPPVPAGQSAPSTPPLSMTVNTPIVTIGGHTALVQFSGLTPGSPGVYQVNAVVPSGIVTGDSVPVTITIAGQTSQPGVTISVH